MTVKLVTLAHRIDDCFTRSAHGAVLAHLPNILAIRLPTNIPTTASDPQKLTRPRMSTLIDTVLCDAASHVGVQDSYLCDAIFHRPSSPAAWYGLFETGGRPYGRKQFFERDLPDLLPLRIGTELMLGLKVALFREVAGTHHPFTQLWGHIALQWQQHPFVSREGKRSWQTAVATHAPYLLLRR